MWLNSHQGSAYTFGPAKRKVEALIQRFEKEHGRLPEDWGQISAAYPKDLTYDYWFRCENHPWDHRESERLDQVVLRRVVPSDWEGHEQYAFSPFGEVDFEHPIYVKR